MVKITLKHDMSAETAVALFDKALALFDTIVSAEGYKVRIGDLPASGMVYAFHNGIKQSLADSKAGIESGDASVPAAAKAVFGRPESVDKNGKVIPAVAPDSKRWDKFTAEAKLPDADPANESDVASVTEAVVKSRQDKRCAAILAGTMTVREDGGRLSVRDAWIRDTATAEIKAKHDKAAKEMPKGNALVELRAKYIAGHATRLAKLADDHFAAMAGVAETADEILGF